MTYDHNDLLRAYSCQLRRQGARVAVEVGVPGGRADMVRLDTDDRWVELYELKVRQPASGVPQLKRYASAIGGDPLLTLVVPPDVVTDELRALADAEGVRLEVLAESQASLFEPDDRPSRWIHLPWHHETTLALAERTMLEGRRFDAELAA